MADLKWRTANELRKLKDEAGRSDIGITTHFLTTPKGLVRGSVWSNDGENWYSSYGSTQQSGPRSLSDATATVEREVEQARRDRYLRRYGQEMYDAKFPTEATYDRPNETE